jgi:phage shock protein PspC (stress-responsive transcriptional regulator)
MAGPRLTRSKDKIIGGVCAGMANHFGLETSLFRIGFALVAFVTGLVPLAFVYLVMWLVIPEE